MKRCFLPLVVLFLGLLAVFAGGGCTTGADGVTRVDPYLRPTVNPDGTVGEPQAVLDLEKKLELTSLRIEELSAAYDRRGEELVRLLEELEKQKAQAATQPTANPADEAARDAKLEKQIADLKKEIALTTESGQQQIAQQAEIAKKVKDYLEAAKAAGVTQIVNPDGQVDVPKAVNVGTSLLSLIPGVGQFQGLIELAAVLGLGLFAAKQRADKTKQANELADAIREIIGPTLDPLKKNMLKANFSDPTLQALKNKGIDV